ncbi:MAG: hypothetical protein ACLGI3_06490, partial [Actinomycetes bacterium]
IGVSGNDAYLQLPADRLKVAERFEYQIAHCDSTGCTSSAIKTDRVNAALAAGPRAGATQLPFTVGDGISAQLDIGSGNLMVTVNAFNLPRRSAAPIAVGLAYNSVTGLSTANFAGSLGSKSTAWRLSTGSDIRLRHVAGHGAVVYYGDDGLTGAFLPNAASPGTYTSPAGFKLDLTSDAANGWTLRDRVTAEQRHFDASGRLVDTQDRNGNKVTFSYTAEGALSAITTDVGPADARKLEVTTAGTGVGRITKLTQRATDASGAAISRAVSFTYDTSNRLTGMTDLLGRTTGFAYGTNNVLKTVTAPGGAATSFTYDSNFRLVSVAQPTADGSTALTRVDYRSWGADVAGPNTDPAVAVVDAPHTRYHVDTAGMLLVAKTTDPAGVVTAATYTAALDVASETANGGT